MKLYNMQMCIGQQLQSLVCGIKSGSRKGVLSLFIQERLRAGRGDTIDPHVQTTSTCNHIIDRIWVELNQRVTYPVKQTIKSMDDSRSINMDCPITKFVYRQYSARFVKLEYGE